MDAVSVDNLELVERASEIKNEGVAGLIIDDMEKMNAFVGIARQVSHTSFPFANLIDASTHRRHRQRD